MENEVTQTINKIVLLLQRAGESIKEASIEFYSACSNDPEFYNKAREYAPWVKESTWDSLFAIGSGRIDWRVATGVAPHHDMLAKLPLNQQEMVLMNGVEYPAPNGDIVHLPISVLTKEQARIVFAGGKVRTASEISNSIKTPFQKQKVVAGVKWRVKNNTLVVMEPCVISKSELIDIYSRIHSK